MYMLNVCNINNQYNRQNSHQKTDKKFKFYLNAFHLRNNEGIINLSKLGINLILKFVFSSTARQYFLESGNVKGIIMSYIRHFI